MGSCDGMWSCGCNWLLHVTHVTSLSAARLTSSPPPATAPLPLPRAAAASGVAKPSPPWPSSAGGIDASRITDLQMPLKRRDGRMRIVACKSLPSASTASWGTHMGIIQQLTRGTHHSRSTTHQAQLLVVRA